MLTRLKVSGFKNLVDVDVSFGPFTCVAGVNSVGKSNLFDAITFLGTLAEKPLTEAALSVRSDAGRPGDVRQLFHKIGDRHASEMTFEAEMLIPRAGIDDLGQEAKAAATFLRYALTLELDGASLRIRREDLVQIASDQVKPHLRFPHSEDWRRSVVVRGRKVSPFIWTDQEESASVVRLRQVLGHPFSYNAEKLLGTVLSDAMAAANPTVALARREMQSWRLLQLEPSALRAPDPYESPSRVASNGAHLAATLARLAGVDPRSGAEQPVRDRAATVYARLSNRLAELIEGVRSVRVDLDDRRALLTLMLIDRDGIEHEARALSDGTLRFLALAILESDPETGGILCVEEPENGIHPQRIPAMLRLLQDLAVDPELPVDEDNPLRQVIVNTHSPAVAAQVPEDSLLVAIPQVIQQHGHRGTVPAFRWLPGTWRAQASPEVPTIPLGQIISYLNPVEPDAAADRVIDRGDLQKWLPSSQVAQSR